ncbi:hypothetical protein F4859DRAFT_476540 [Xylaria cf. heliscus]|nr:hypothetical protein F4859DRAFT_476540 [Xylaria cf. heliscus]
MQAIHTLPQETLTTTATRTLPSNTATMAPKKWDDKAERDLLIAIRIAESGYNPVTRDTWNKATEVMKMMGYPDATVSNLRRHFLLAMIALGAYGLPYRLERFPRGFYLSKSLHKLYLEE